MKARVKKYEEEYWVFIEKRAIIRAREVYVDGKRIEEELAELEVDVVSLADDVAYLWAS